LFVIAILLTILLITIFIRAIVKLREKKTTDSDDEGKDFIENPSLGDEESGENQGSIYYQNNFRLPVSYQKIQNQKPWKHRNVPTVSVTQVRNMRASLF